MQSCRLTKSLLEPGVELPREGSVTLVATPSSYHLDSHRLVTDEEVVILHHPGEVGVVAGDGKTKNILKWT